MPVEESPATGGVTLALPEASAIASVPAAPLAALLEAARDGDQRSLIVAATQAMLPHLGERGSCVLLDPLRVVYASHAPMIVDWPVDMDRYPEVSTAIATGLPVAIDDVWLHPLLARVRDQMPRALSSVMAIPVIGGGRCVGVLLAQSAQPRSFDSSSLALASLLGGLLGALLAPLRATATAETIVPSVARAAPSRAPVIRAGERARTLSPGSSRQTIKPSRPRRGRRVLVAEDEEAHASLVRAILEGMGHQVDVVSDGASAVERARATLPDLILLDVLMPGTDGFAAAEELQRDPATSDIPILFVSACDDLMARVHGLEIGAVDFLPKPFFAPELLARVERSLEQVDARARLRGQAQVDELTGLGNLRFLHERLTVEKSRAERYGTALALVMLDVDKLKLINDRHGHEAGSRVLAAVGALLAAEVRDTDVAVRYGGDEFVVVLPHATLIEGARFADRVLARLAALRVPGDELGPISLSVGVAAHGAGERADFEDLLRRADAAAYRAKRAGGGRACVDERGHSPASASDAR